MLCPLLRRLSPCIGNSRVRRILSVAALAGVELEHDKSFTFASEWKTPEFLEKNPFGFVPVLELEDGTTLRESAAIAEYSEFDLPLHGAISAVEWRRTDLCSGMKPKSGVSGVEGVQRKRLDCLKDETSISVIPVLMTCVENFPAGGTVIPLTKQSFRAFEKRLLDWVDANPCISCRDWF